jgi:hypothetical protein
MTPRIFYLMMKLYDIMWQKMWWARDEVDAARVKFYKDNIAEIKSQL